MEKEFYNQSTPYSSSPCETEEYINYADREIIIELLKENLKTANWNLRCIQTDIQNHKENVVKFKDISKKIELLELLLQTDYNGEESLYIKNLRRTLNEYKEKKSVLIGDFADKPFDFLIQKYKEVEDTIKFINERIEGIKHNKKL